MRLDPDQLAALSAILRFGSFEAAARALNVTSPAISQRIKALEDRVGAPLILRGSPCTATEAGRHVTRHADQVAQLEAHLARELGHRPEARPIRIALNADSLATWFPAALARTDGMLFDLEVDDQAHSDTWLREGAVSAAVTARSTPVQGCDCYPLGALMYVATASPGFAARWFPDGVTAQALAQAPMLVFNQKDRLQHEWMAQFCEASPATPIHRIPSTTGFVEAALHGLGWGLNPAELVEPLIKSGALVAIGGEAARMGTPLHWQVSRLLAPALEPLTRAIRAQARLRLRGL
ncbi:LysR family transcriptional regulator ArgP [Pseudoprimorskyibacter insulae]|nr:LysR family transcriptional regulator ArgP [Pseudoprimorskyibacter insulae]